MLVPGARRAERALEADDQERQRHERLGQHHRGGGERDPDAPQLEVLRRAAPALPKVYSNAMPPTTGGSTSGSSTRARRMDWPGNCPRASTSAIGTPISTQTTVLAPAVFRLNISAARDDSEVMRPMKFGQSILSRIAISGAMTNSAPSVAGR